MNRGIRFVRTGLIANGGLALVKLLAGLLGNSYALVADAVESIADTFSSFVVWTGLRISSRDADQRYPFGYGKAESVSAAIVGLMLLGAALGIAIEAVREIVTPHHAPAPFTLVVLVVVVVSSSSPSSPCTTSTLDWRAANTPAITSARLANAQPISPARGCAGLVSGPRRLNTVGTPISRRTTAAYR